MRKSTATLAPAMPTTETKPAVASALTEPSPDSPPVSEEGIRLRAYQKWEIAEKPAGNGIDFWLEAEKEVLQARLDRHAEQ